MDLVGTLHVCTDKSLPWSPQEDRHERFSSRSSASNGGTVYSLPSQISSKEPAPIPVSSGAIRSGRCSAAASLVSSHIGSCSSLGLSNASSSFSAVTVPSVIVPDKGLPGDTRAEVTVEHPYKRREYMNDTQGTILSPPVVRPSRTPPTMTASIGSYLITLEATQLKINHRSLRVNDYDIGLAFFEKLKQHPKDLDSLYAAICQGDDDWEGIPGWVVNPSNWTL